MASDREPPTRRTRVERKLDSERWYVLQHIVPHINQAEHELVLAEVLDALRPVRDMGERARLLGHVVPLLPVNLVREAFAHLDQALTATSDAVEAFTNLAPRLPEDLLPAALTFIRDRLVRIGLGFDAAALAALAPRLGACHAHEALRLAESIERESDRALAMFAVLPLLNDAERTANLESTLLLAVRAGNRDVGARAGEYLAREPAEVRARLLTATMRAATRSRQAGLTTVGALAPALAAAGGESTIADCIEAVQQTARWWP
jgi:hypothetical protein